MGSADAARLEAAKRVRREAGRLQARDAEKAKARVRAQGARLARLKGEDPAAFVARNEFDPSTSGAGGKGFTLKMDGGGGKTAAAPRELDRELTRKETTRARAPAAPTAGEWACPRPQASTPRSELKRRAAVAEERARAALLGEGALAEGRRRPVEAEAAAALEAAAAAVERLGGGRGGGEPALPSPSLVEAAAAAALASAQALMARAGPGERTGAPEARADPNAALSRARALLRSAA
mmetsp:Transcript_6749/g.22411  ORF Transcript_6749/g.22411 Transcript_6749/m.22411 type:complete len:238 (+) Transcript_6749:2-715(+)